MTEKSVLLIGHTATRECGRIAPLLREKGYAPRWCCPCEGEALPPTDAALSGAIVLGGLQSANHAESSAFIRDEIDWIGGYVAAGGRYLGICLGGQLLARALGAAVRPHPGGLNEIGYYPVRPTEAGRRLMAEPMHVYQWHEEGFDIPAGAELLVTGDDFPNQAFRYGERAYGLQFHPEVTPEVATRWIGSTEHHLSRKGAQDRSTQIEGMKRFDKAMHDWLDRFLDHWLGGDVSRAQVGSPRKAVAGG